MKTFLDLVGKQSPEEDTFPKSSVDPMLQTTEYHENTTKSLLDAPATNVGEGKWTDPLVQGLVDRLPKPDSLWPLNERAKWLRTAAGIFDLIYKAHNGDDREISIGFVGQGTGNLPVASVELAEVDHGEGAKFDIGASSPVR